VDWLSRLLAVYGRKVKDSVASTSPHRALPKPSSLVAASTEREKDYLRAVQILYGEGDKKSRDFAYAEAMRQLFEKYPEQDAKTSPSRLVRFHLAQMRAAYMIESGQPYPAVDTADLDLPAVAADLLATDRCRGCGILHGKPRRARERPQSRLCGRCPNDRHRGKGTRGDASDGGRKD
jgi:hypothetical protein